MSLPPPHLTPLHTNTQTNIFEAPLLYLENIHDRGKCLRAGHATEVDFRLRWGFLSSLHGPPSLPVGTGRVKLANVTLPTRTHTRRLVSWCAIHTKKLTILSEFLYSQKASRISTSVNFMGIPAIIRSKLERKNCGI